MDFTAGSMDRHILVYDGFFFLFFLRFITDVTAAISLTGLITIYKFSRYDL